MLTSVIQIGNSRGIRLPKRIFQELKIKDEVELTINKDSLIIKGVKKSPRQGWNEAFAKKFEDKTEKLLLP
ncbi:MAG: AbrB/MazE/SpoVT family DNA-binding domain-containing protein, partial [Treponema sp.]|nr:AbrB/MazE/SpoVT family DNA-binding domain-containing protein [Treponema sp.]